VQIALREWRGFGQPVVYPNIELPEDEEREEGLWQRVGEYWVAGSRPALAGTKAGPGYTTRNGVTFPASEDGNYAWSAAFISYVMRITGAGTHRFPYTPTHSDYINAARGAIRSELEPGTALSAERVEFYAPQRGDLICYWRGRQPVTYEELPTGRFPGHWRHRCCNPVRLSRCDRRQCRQCRRDEAHPDHRRRSTSPAPTASSIDPDHHYFVVLQVEYLR